MHSHRPARPRRRVSLRRALTALSLGAITSAAVAQLLSNSSPVNAASFSVLHTFNAHSDGINPQGNAVLLLASDGNLYGTTSGGGTNNGGTLYKLTTGGTLTTLHSFTNNVDGYNPSGTLLQGKDGYLYGVAYNGSTNGNGAVYKCKTDGSSFSVIHIFNNNSGEGYNPNAGLVQASDGYLYGTTFYGAANNDGVIYKLSTDGKTFDILQAIDGSKGSSVYTTLVSSGSTLYGIGYTGGANNAGALFSIKTDGTSYNLLFSYGTANTGSNPIGLLLNEDSNLYIASRYGGGDNYGAISKYTVSTKKVSLVHSFTAGASDGAYPTNGLTRDSSGNLYLTTYNGGTNNDGTFERVTEGGSARVYRSFAANTYLTVAPTPSTSSSPTTFYTPTLRSGVADDGYVLKLSSSGSGSQTTIYDFANGFFDGSHPYQGALLQSSDGVLHGTTSQLVLNGSIGTVFHISTSGDNYVQDAQIPGTPTGYLATVNGDYYGLTVSGGYYGSGSLFVLDSSADNGYETLQSLGQGAGTNPYGGLRLGKDGNLYGTTYYGGDMNAGAIFSVTPDGIETILYSFDGTHGANPNARLIQDSSGTFYGTTYNGGTANQGTVFSYTPAGGLKTLCSLTTSTGYNPAGSVTVGPSDYLYFTARYGAAYGQGSVVRVKDTGGTPSTVYSFGAQSGGTDGEQPFAALYLATDGRLYGTTLYGGTSNNGVVFTLTTGGSYRLVHSLKADGTEGATPYSGVIEGSDGNFYGVTNVGGVQPYPSTDVEGTLFKIATALPRITSFTPTSGKSGTKVVITGVNFTGASAVTFNGVSATYTVNSSTQITATVPSGSTTGLVAVTTSSGTATSSQTFTMTN